MWRKSSPTLAVWVCIFAAKIKTMKIATILSEVVHDGRICMEPQAFHAIRGLMFSNMEMKLEVEDSEKEHAEQMVLGAKTEDNSQGEPANTGNRYLFPSDAFSPRARHEFYGSLAPEDKVINVITIAGPMTRGGRACSYGSIDQRNLILEAADVPQVVGHIILTRTPGGMASTIRDYRLAREYANAKGQKVYMLCDGDVASGGAFVGTTACDKIYAVNPDDEIGSLGMYCAFFTQKDGDKNTITQETYHEYYASASKDKNAWYRAAADGDMSLIEEEVNKDLQQLLDDVRSARPSVLEEQLSGKMYRMGDVVGSLIDGFTSLPELALMMMDEAEADDKNDGSGEQQDGEGGTPKGETFPPDGDDDDDENTSHEGNNNDKQNKNDDNMKTYEHMGKAAGLEVAFEQQQDGFVQLSEEQADALEATLTAQEADKETLATLQAQVDELNAEKATLEQQLTDANAKNEELTASLATKEEELTAAKAATETAVAEAKAEMETALAEKQQALDTANETVATQQATIDTQNATIESQQATIDTQNATIAELNESAANKGQGGGAAQNNGQGAQQKLTYSTEGQYDHTLSPAENKKRIDAYNKKLEQQRAQGL